MSANRGKISAERVQSTADKGALVDRRETQRQAARDDVRAHRDRAVTKNLATIRSPYQMRERGGKQKAGTREGERLHTAHTRETDNAHRRDRYPVQAVRT